MTATLTRPAAHSGDHVPVLRLGALGALHWRRRAVLVCLAMLAVGLIASLLTVTVGELGIPLRELPDVLAGNGSRAQEWVLRANRLPRLLVGALAGAAFGVAGAIFQSVTRNPLGSPDVIGLGAGAAAGAAAAALVWPGIVPVAVGALIGAGVAIGAVYVGSGRGFAAPYRMVVTGIAVGAMALAFVQLALARATHEDAFAMSAWLNGSLASRRWSDVTLIAAALVVLIPMALLLTRRLQLVEMGDDAATGLGVDPTRTRNLAVGVAVLLTAAAVTVSGPVAFVALTSPQIARRLTRSTGPGMVAAACTGATVLVVADLIAQRLPFGVQYPVGVVTAALGGVYLAILLIREWRRGAV
ncbi:FecCD family ABC transporter permease [Cellulomonas chengniuliangii]|uniref:FecCD family ABC transporter permease n=1 Tax=Cellulomonas chengniuliangii TaxID=2968084 RepID=UPI001D0E8E8C|nr:iron chelate uptake ABC transporter family permease subunit [Cellulomonas chengniuliangii]MCC2318782.1 iron chelate uptake ABC transporter family permease subunit [Cellulomonas chengniuliangii]